MIEERTMMRLALGLFVIVLGVDLGAGLYESRVVVPLWSSGIPETLAAGNPFGRVAIDAGIGFWSVVTPVVALFAVVALLTGFRAPQPQRAWQLFAAVAELCAFAMTMLYFRPTLQRLFLTHGSGLTTAAIATMVRWWVGLSWVRVAISFLAWCAAIRALSLSR